MLAENQDIYYFCLFFSTVQNVLECKLKQQFHKIDAYMKEKKIQDHLLFMSNVALCIILKFLPKPGWNEITNERFILRVS